jgi:biofilm protein TabA
MKTTFSKIMLMATIFSFFGCKVNNDPSAWSKNKIDGWFNKGEWRNGWAPAPDATINRKLMAESYFKIRERWDKAFKFLKENDLTKLENKRHDIDGDNVYIIISEYNTKEPETARYEAHRKYADIQYVAAGNEMIGVAPLTSRGKILQAYDESKDIEFAEYSNGKLFPASPDNFFVFFPEDGHMPSVKVNAVGHVKKAVVKVKLD